VWTAAEFLEAEKKFGNITEYRLMMIFVAEAGE